MRGCLLKINLNATYNIVLFENQPSDLIRLDTLDREFIFQTEILELRETIEATV